MKSFKDYAKILGELREMDSKNQNILFKEVAEVDCKTEQVFLRPLIKTDDNTWKAKDELLGEMANAYESAGFIMGFISAMKITYRAEEVKKEAGVI